MILDNSSLKALRLLLLLACVTPGGVFAEQSTGEVMAKAMARMMDAMGLFDSESSIRGGGSPPDPMSMMDPMAAAGWGPGFPGPWGGPYQNPSRALEMGEMMKRFSEQIPGAGAGWPAPWTASRLEGVWEGRNGELLIVQGERFRIYSPGMKRVDGLMQIRENRLALYNPIDEHAQPFEFAESRGRLVMRDLEGQTYLYRRLRLDGGQPSGSER